MFSKKGSKKSNKVEPDPNKKPMKIFEPFQEVVDEAMEMNWLELENHSLPLEELGVDKSTASQAVALVIRASRRGVVSLCAEVADLLKDKDKLETVIEEQKQEIFELLSNQNLPRSPSPPPPETSDFTMQTVQEMECQTTSLADTSTQTEVLTLPCAKSKTLDENDKLLTPTTKIFGVNFECGSDYTVQCVCPKMITTSTQSPVMTSIGTNTDKKNKLQSDHGYFEHQSLDEHVKALQEKTKTLKRETKEKSNKTIKLETELTSAKEEIVTLQKAVQELQTKEYEKIKEEERLKMEETYSVDVQNNVTSFDDSSDISEKDFNIVIKQEKRRSPDGTSMSLSTSVFPGPILGCKCRMCTAFFRSTGLLGFASTPYVTNSSGRNPVLKDMRKLVSLQNSQLQVYPNDQVLLQNRATGTVRYVGHLDGAEASSTVYAGIELADARGKHDGYLFGKRYFFAPQNHGLFLPLQDIICVTNKKITSLPSPQRRSTSSKNKKSNNRMRAGRKSSEETNKSSTLPKIASAK